MARNKFYTQCKLQRKEEYGSETMTSWIPSDKAVKGLVIKLKEWPSDKRWSEGWEVLEVYSKVEGEKVEGSENDYKNQRKMSDI